MIDVADERTDDERRYDAMYWPVADSLASEGKKPTQELIRQVTGGSYSYIGPSLKRWRRRQKPTVSAMPTDLPEEMRSALAQAAGILWGRATQMANDRIRRVEEMAQERLAEYEADEVEQQKEILRLESEVKTKDGEIAVLTDERDTQQKEIERLGKELANARGTIEAQQKQIEALTSRVDQLNGEVQHLSGEAAKWEESAAGLARRLESSEQHGIVLADKNTSLERDLQASNTLASERHTAIEDLRAQLQDQKAQAERRIEELRDARSEADARARSASDQVLQLSSQLKESTERHAIELSNAARAQAQADERASEVLRLRSELKVEVDRLREQIGDLQKQVGEKAGQAERELALREQLEKQLENLEKPKKKKDDEE